MKTGNPTGKIGKRKLFIFKSVSVKTDNGNASTMHPTTVGTSPPTTSLGC